MLQASLERGLWLSEQQELNIEKQVLYQKLIIILYNNFFY